MKKVLPASFKPWFWAYDFKHLNPQIHKLTVIRQLINYGDLQALGWMRSFYGDNQIREVIKNTSATAFRAPALKLAQLIFKTRNFKHAPRGLNRSR